MPAAAAASNGAGGFGASDEVATAHMEPVQRDCYRIFNTPEAHASEVGVTMDTVNALPQLCLDALHTLKRSEAERSAENIR